MPGEHIDIVTAIVLITFAFLVLRCFVEVRSRPRAPLVASWSLLKYLTIWTNLLVMVVYGASALAPHVSILDGGPPPQVVCALTLYVIVVMGTYYGVLYAPGDKRGLAWFAEFGTHAVVPALVVFDFVGMDTPVSIHWWFPFIWVLPPFAYALAAVSIGRVIGSYPYDFLDVEKRGLPATIAIIGSFTLCYIVLGFGLLSVANFSMP